MKFSLPQASSYAPNIDRLFDAMVWLCGLVAIGVFMVMIVFCVKYRSGSSASRVEGKQRELGIELFWTLVPFALFVIIFAWSIDLWAKLRTPPSGSMPVYVVAKQWMWKVQHANGAREIDALHVPVGRSVRLVMTSEDVIHSFYVPAFRVKQDVLPGRYTQLWFTATQTGEFPLFCTEFCGTDHAAMHGVVYVMNALDYVSWANAHASESLQARGKDLFVQLGCSGCHDSKSGIHAPDLRGLYGSTVALANGSTTIASDRYIHDAILLPANRAVAGYAPIMPVYQDRVGEEDVLALIAYIKSDRPQRGAGHD